ncbi:MAG TPA: hypothetical protein VFQ45_23015, partial [Longimicrobium sp.]|nr:hypothetical protein [Longimicrobium sp.]
MKRIQTNTTTALLAAALLLLAACGGGDEPADKAKTAGDTTAAPGDTTGGGTPSSASNVPAGPTTNLPPNELGRIMVLEYHRLTKGGQSEGEWFRTLENFKKDLRTLYEKGYRPVTMRQVLEGDIDLPRGTTPVVFTIDDASYGQFYYRPDGTIDP